MSFVHRVRRVSQVAMESGKSLPCLASCCQLHSCADCVAERDRLSPAASGPSDHLSTTVGLEEAHTQN